MPEEKAGYESSLKRHFILRVLAPPFVAILLLSVIVLWQLGRILHRQAIDGLKRSATTTAATLNREFNLRETVLKQTGAELFVIKHDYVMARQTLDANRTACHDFIKQKSTYKNAPGGVCDPFLSAFAVAGPSLSALEDEYVRLGENLIKSQSQRTDERLSAFKQFFPETLALLIIDDQKHAVSSAYSPVFKTPPTIIQTTAEAALTNAIRGKVVIAQDYRLALFAFQVPGGSVVAAYDTQNENFIRQTWASAPIDHSREVAVVLDANGNVVYPQFKNSDQLTNNFTKLRIQPIIANLDNIPHTVVSALAGSSDWMVAVASPTAAVIAPLRDAQLLGVVLIGLFMVAFLWVGTFFIQRTLGHIVTLVSGALVFGSGRLDYKISLEHADSEFRRLADTMNAMAERIAADEKEIDEKNKEFISIATHELRAPLSAIIGHLSLFKEMFLDHQPDKAKLLIDEAYYGTARLRDLVNDMLDVARLESGRSESALMPVQIKPVIQQIIDNMEVVAKLAKVKLTYKPTHATTVLADEQRLHIIINNFVSNAIKYNRQGGYVKVWHEVRDGRLVTAVEDDGLGIPEEQKAKMFEKFFRVEHEDRKNVTGTGLGMYITKEYIEQMHGKLWFESTHGKGTTFYFSLPIVKASIATRLKNLVKHRSSTS